MGFNHFQSKKTKFKHSLQFLGYISLTVQIDLEICTRRWGFYRIFSRFSPVNYLLIRNFQMFLLRKYILVIYDNFVNFHEISANSFFTNASWKLYGISISLLNQSIHRSSKVLEIEKCPGKFLKSLGICYILWEILEKYRNLMQYPSDELPFPSILYKLLPSCYVRYSTSFLLVCLPVSRIKI